MAAIIASSELVAELVKIRGLGMSWFSLESDNLQSNAVLMKSTANPMPYPIKSRVSLFTA